MTDEAESGCRFTHDDSRRCSSRNARVAAPVAHAIARLKPGVTLEQARAELTTIADAARAARTRIEPNRGGARRSRSREETSSATSRRRCSSARRGRLRAAHRVRERREPAARARRRRGRRRSRFAPRSARSRRRARPAAAHREPAARRRSAAPLGSSSPSVGVDALVALAPAELPAARPRSALDARAPLHVRVYRR